MDDYLVLRAAVAAQGFTDAEIDELIISALEGFGIVNTNVKGDVLARVSDETKAKALRALL